MKVLQITAPHAFRILDMPVPEPGDGDVVVRVDAVTTCPQWDLHLRHNEPMFAGHRFTYPYAPGQPGHEATGEVSAIGSSVTGVAVGDRVSIWRDPGHDQAGCYAQFVRVKAENVIRVPIRFAPDAIAPVELAMCVGASFLMLRAMRAIAGRHFVVMGLGPAGLIALQMARAEGAAHVIGYDFSQARRDVALRLGADMVYDPRGEEAASLPFRPGATVADCGIDCVGARVSVEYLMDRVETTLALFGVQREDYTYSLRHYRNLRLCGYPGHSRAAAEYAVALIERGDLDLTPLVTHWLPLERYGDGVDLLERQEAIKICFDPWRS